MTLHYLQCWRSEKYTHNNNKCNSRVLAESWTNFSFSFCTKVVPYHIDIGTIFFLSLLNDFHNIKYIEKKLSTIRKLSIRLRRLRCHSSFWWCDVVCIIVVVLCCSCWYEKRICLKNIFQIIYFEVSYCIFSLQNGGLFIQLSSCFFSCKHNIHFLFTPKKYFNFIWPFIKRKLYK